MNTDQLVPETKEFWEFVGERLVVGQERYGTAVFKADVDLSQMSLEEVADFAVYMMAMVWKRLKEANVK